jgi:hypothetical protein
MLGWEDKIKKYVRYTKVCVEEIDFVMKRAFYVHKGRYIKYVDDMKRLCRELDTLLYEVTCLF